MDVTGSITSIIGHWNALVDDLRDINMGTKEDYKTRQKSGYIEEIIMPILDRITPNHVPGHQNTEPPHVHTGEEDTHTCSGAENHLEIWPIPG